MWRASCRNLEERLPQGRCHFVPRRKCWKSRCWAAASGTQGRAKLSARLRRLPARQSTEIDPRTDRVALSDRHQFRPIGETGQDLRNEIPELPREKTAVSSVVLGTPPIGGEAMDMDAGLRGAVGGHCAGE